LSRSTIIRNSPALLAGMLALTAFLPVAPEARAQEDPNEVPLGDVARNLRKKIPPEENVINNDNLKTVMDQAESKRPSDSVLKFLMSGDERNFQVSAPDVTCSLAFTVSSKALLSNQYAQMDLPASELPKLTGPASIEGDALTVSIFNGTGWHVSELDVALTVITKNAPNATLPSATDSDPLPLSQVRPLDPVLNEVRPEKKADMTVIYHMRAAASPFSSTVFSAPLNLGIAPGEEWHWAIVQAKGYPSAVQMEARTQNKSSAGPAIDASQINAPAVVQPAAQQIPLNPSAASFAQPQ
jgi:hypothetical protein